MVKKILTYTLLFSSLQFVGCYSYSTLYPDPYQEIKKEISEADEIIVNLKNAKKYKFAKGYYYFQNDTLTGEGFAIINDIEEPYKGSIPFSQIRSIQIVELDSEKTLTVVGGIIAIGTLLYLNEEMKGAFGF